MSSWTLEGFSFSLKRGNKGTLCLKVLPEKLLFEISLISSLHVLAEKHLHLWNLHIFTGFFFPLSHWEQIFIKTYKIVFEKLKQVTLYGSQHHMVRFTLHCQWPAVLAQLLLHTESSRREGHWEGTRRGRVQQGCRRLKRGILFPLPQCIFETVVGLDLLNPVCWERCIFSDVYGGIISSAIN